MVGGTVLVRPESDYGFARASYELNLGCDYDCEHCYLGEKLFSGMEWPNRQKLLDVDGAGRMCSGSSSPGRAANRLDVHRDARLRVGPSA